MTLRHTATTVFILFVVTVATISIWNLPSGQAQLTEVTTTQFYTTTSTIGTTIPDWMTAFGTVGAVVLALFLHVIRKRYLRPRLEIEFINEPPICRSSGLRIAERWGAYTTVPTYWIRLRVKNNGRSIARGCEGKLIRIIFASNMKEKTDFDPIILHWSSGLRHPVKRNPIDINKEGDYDYLDLVYAREDDPNKFYLQEEGRSESNPRGIDMTPSRQDYILHVVVYGKNCSPCPGTFLLKNSARFNGIRLEPL